MKEFNLERMREIFFAPVPWFEQFGTKTDTPHGPLVYKDNGADVLCVCHLDSVQDRKHFRVRESKQTVHSAQVDDRVGAYVLLEMLPKLGVNVDWLFTVGEEKGQSSAEYFKTDKKYNWMMEPDRTGDDAVLYQYGYHSDKEWRAVLIEAGFKLATGSFTDISVLEGLGCKGVNVGVGYYDYHSISGYVRLDILSKQMEKFANFWKLNKNTHFPHKKVEYKQTQFPVQAGGYYDYSGKPYVSEWEKKRLAESMVAEVYLEYDPEFEVELTSDDGEIIRIMLPLSIIADAIEYAHDIKQAMIKGHFKGRMNKEAIFGYLAEQSKEIKEDEQYDEIITKEKHGTERD